MSRNTKPYLFIGLAAAALLWLFNYFAPLEPASVAVYAGAVVALCGLVCVVKPVSVVGIRTRRVAAIVGLSGIVLIVVALNWPAGVSRVAQRSSRLDDVMPEYHFYERHEVRVHAGPEVAAAALRSITFDDIGVYTALMRLRAAASGHFRASPSAGGINVFEAIGRPGSGFVLLEEDAKEVVMGMAGRPWAGGKQLSVRTAEDYAAFNQPESVKVAFNFTVTDEGGGWSRIATETRIRAMDDRARTIMARYWRVIYPGSGMIRRMMLNAARQRAEVGS